jgi:hypothetical protein
LYLLTLLHEIVGAIKNYLVQYDSLRVVIYQNNARLD